MLKTYIKRRLIVRGIPTRTQAIEKTTTTAKPLRTKWLGLRLKIATVKMIMEIGLSRVTSFDQTNKAKALKSRYSLL